MADNPSVVNDPSGNNYTIGMGGIGGDAQMQYLENLAQLAQKMPPKPLNTDQYFPNADKNIQVGTFGGKAIGNVPIFATGGGLFPFAVIDEMQRAKAEAEASFYKSLKFELDKPLSNIQTKLSDPFKQPAFGNKIREVADNTLDTYARRFGGDYTKAYIATMYDKDFQRTMQGFQDYANMFNLVGAKVAEVVKDEKDGRYVSPAVKGAIAKFANVTDALEDLPPSKLLESSQEFKSVMAVSSLADAATKGIKDTVVDQFIKAPSMSTDEEEAWIKKSVSNKGLVDTLFKNIVDANDWLKNDESQKTLLRSELEGRVDHSVKEALDLVKKSDADRNIALRKQGVNMDENGNVILNTKPAALIDTVGQNAISYPIETKNIPSIVGMVAFVKKDGRLRRIKLPESYEMKLQSEYDIVDQNKGVPRGRYVEANLNFQSTAPYNSTIYRNVKGIPVDMGETKGVTQVLPTKVEDLDTHEELDLMGPTTVLTPYENLRTIVEANVPYMGFVHDQIDKKTYPFGGRRTYGLSNENTTAAIPLTDTMSIDDIKPDLNYVRNGKTISGVELIRLHEKKLNK